MGNCIPVEKSTEPAMNHKSSVISQEKNKANGHEHDLSMAELNSKLQSSSPMPNESNFRVLSNREEMFFDSQPWLESDIEDFISVNGEFTPLGGNSPVHQNSIIKNPQYDASPYFGSTSSPTDMKKQLIELFHESFNNDVVDDCHIKNLQDSAEAKPIAFYFPWKCSGRSSYKSANNSICSSRTAPNGCSIQMKGKPAQSAQGCLPNLVRSLTFSERKKRLIPAYNCGK